uniref:Uncharacterized protein n=1 Tax=Lepeophtheirus salmonis TaxID=72036 RepID=A0A0K2UBT2_LEPSM
MKKKRLIFTIVVCGGLETCGLVGRELHPDNWHKNAQNDGVWARKKQDIPSDSVVKHPLKIMVWEDFGALGVSVLHVVDSNKRIKSN